MRISFLPSVDRQILSTYLMCKDLLIIVGTKDLGMDNITEMCPLPSLPGLSVAPEFDFPCYCI